jgi:hypothetical protein
MAPALGMHSLAVLAPIEEIGPLLVAACAGVVGPRDVRLSAVDELELGTRAAEGTVNQQHVTIDLSRPGTDRHEKQPPAGSFP